MCNFGAWYNEICWFTAHCACSLFCGWSHWVRRRSTGKEASSMCKRPSSKSSSCAKWPLSWLCADGHSNLTLGLPHAEPSPRLCWFMTNSSQRCELVLQSWCRTEFEQDKNSNQNSPHFSYLHLGQGQLSDCFCDGALQPTSAQWKENLSTSLYQLLLGHPSFYSHSLLSIYRPVPFIAHILVDIHFLQKYKLEAELKNVLDVRTDIAQLAIQVGREWPT